MILVIELLASLGVVVCFEKGCLRIAFGYLRLALNFLSPLLEWVVHAQATGHLHQ